MSFFYFAIVEVVAAFSKDKLKKEIILFLTALFKFEKKLK